MVVRHHLSYGIIGASKINPPPAMRICRRVSHEVDFLTYWHEEPFAAHGDFSLPDATPNLANRGSDSQCSL
jgi:hypothetical protein